MDQIAFEKDAVEDAIVKLRRRGSDADFVSGSIREWQVIDRRQRRGILQSLASRPYFGRIDFVEDGIEHPDIVYVGSGSLSEQGLNFIHDWRADISGLYYRHAVGSATFSCPSGSRSGAIGLHRTFTIEERRLRGYRDLGDGAEGEGAADDMLIGLLGQQSTGKMRQIVHSIQAEQDSIIRNPAEIVAIQGPAGSGKTIIALHRAAYLLYHHRIARPTGGVTSRRMLAFSPNRAFANYIASVLPDLNEGQIRQVILHPFLLDLLKRVIKPRRGQTPFRIESSEEQFEAVLGILGSAEFASRKRSCEFKSSRAMADLVEAYATTQEEFAESLLVDVTVPSSTGVPGTFFSHAEMSATFGHAGRSGSSLAHRLRSVMAAVSASIADASKRHMIGSDTIHILQEQARRIEQSFAPLLSMNPLDAYAAIWSHREMLAGAAADRKALDSIGQIAEETLASLHGRRILAEDIVPVLMLDGLLNGFPRLENTDHAVIDEAQDYSLLHFEYLKRCLPENCTLTLVGDRRQATNPLSSLGSYAVLDDVFSKKIEHLELTRSYRSSLEISEFTGRIIPRDAAIESVRRSTRKPMLVSVGEPANAPRAIAALLRNRPSGPAGSTAVICRSMADSEALSRELKVLTPVSLVTDETKAMPPGTYVLPIRLAKGLEFDTVIVHDAGRAFYRHEEDRRILYTACSRALHELYVCYSGEPSPLLPLDNTDLYIRSDLDFTALPDRKRE